MFFGKKLWKHLDQVLSSDSFLIYYQDLQERVEALQVTPGPKELVTELRKGGRLADRQDAILLLLIAEYQRGPCPEIQSLLLVLLRRRLEWLFHSLHKQQQNEALLWNDLAWAILNELWDYPVARRTQGVAGNVQLGALKRLTRWKKRDARYQFFSGDPADRKRTEFDYEALLDDRADHPNELIGARRCQRGKADLTLRPDDHEEAIDCLRSFLEDGVISQAAYYVLIATRVYGRSVRAYTDEQALPFEATRKLRQRAEQAIRKAVAEKSAEDDVPNEQDDGLSFDRGMKPRGGDDGN